MDSDKKLDVKIINEMGKEGLFTHFNSKDITDDLTQEKLLELCIAPKDIKFEDGELFILDDNNDKVKMPDWRMGVEKCGTWLSPKLPLPQYDILQGGNIRKAQEAESAYICLVIRNILDNTRFHTEFRASIDNYDFDAFKTNDSNSKNFKDLLVSWQSLNSFAINVIVSACKLRISDQKKDTEKFLKDGLTEEESTGLEDVNSEVKSVYNKYTGDGGPLNPKNIKAKKLKKKEILDYIGKQEKEVNDILNNHAQGTLFRILTLSTEYVDPITKKEMKYVVEDKVNKYFDDSYESNLEEKGAFQKRLYNRVIRLQRTSVRKKQMLDYLSDRTTYELPSKL